MNKPVSITVEQAFTVVVELFKECKDEKDRFRKALEWIDEHECTAEEYQSFVAGILRPVEKGK